MDRNEHGQSLYVDPNATLVDLRESVETLEDLERTARRVLGGAHPLLENIEDALRNARAELRAREETQPSRGAQERHRRDPKHKNLSLIHISEPTRP